VRVRECLCAAARGACPCAASTLRCACAHIRLRRGAKVRWVPLTRTSRLDGVVRQHTAVRRCFAARAVRQNDVQRRDGAQGGVQPGCAQQVALHGARRVSLPRHHFVHESRVRMLRLRARAYSGACRWLEGLCAVLNRIVEAHDKRGAQHTNVM
jgi:hypothetical protein